MIRSTIAHGRRQRPSRIATLVAFGALLAAACGTTPSPSPSVGPSPSRSASAASSSAAPTTTEAAACSAADIGASGGPWGGAAGSRGSDIVVQNHGSAACLLPAGPTVALLDAGGAILLSTPARAGSGPTISPGGTIGFSLLIGNWCAQGTPMPIHFRMALASDAVDIANLVAATRDELPPCNGPGQPASLSTSDWEP